MSNTTAGQTYLLSREQAARALNVSIRTVQAYSRRGLIPTVRIGRRTMYRPEDLAEFSERGTTEPVNAA